MPSTNISTHALPNGLKLILQPLPYSPSTAVTVLVGTGSRHETDQQAGICHFLEHMGFKGTDKRPSAQQIASLVDGVGGAWNAFTGREYTGYYIKVASKDSPLAIDLLSDILTNSLYQEDEANRERGVIIEELRMYRDLPQERVDDLYQSLVFPNQALGREIIGTEQSLANINHQALATAAHTWHVPANMIVSIAGNIDPKQIKDQVEQFFAFNQAGSRSTYQPATSTQTAPQLSVLEKEADQAHVILGYRSFGRTDNRRDAAMLLNIILGGNMSSRLFSEVRERRGLAYAIHTSSDEYSDAGTFNCQVGVNRHKVAEAIQVIIDQFKQVAANGVEQAELDKAKNFITGQTALSMEDPLGQALFQARQQLLFETPRTIDQLLAQLQAVTLDQVKQVAADIVRPEQLNLAAVGPGLDQAQLADILNAA